MAMITNNEFGMINVENAVVCKMIADNMLEMSAEIVPCNKRGKAIKRNFITGYSELFHSVEFSESPEGIKVKVYYILRGEHGAEETSAKLFDMIESDFSKLCLDLPAVLTASIKGVQLEKSFEPRDEVMSRVHNG